MGSEARRDLVFFASVIHESVAGRYLDLPSWPPGPLPAVSPGGI